MAQSKDERRKGVNILLAEDDPTNQYVFHAILQTAGYAVRICENGLLALEQARREPPQIILLDMMMPVMDGYTAAGHLAGDRLFDGIPILALTAKAMKGDLESALEAGCDGYISKPVSRKTLIDTIVHWLDRPQEEWMPARLERRRSRERSA